MPRPVKHSFTIRGHRTSISLEQQFWDALNGIAESQGRPVAAIVQEIDRARTDDGGLSSWVRIWILEHYQSQHPSDRHVDGRVDRRTQP